MNLISNTYRIISLTLAFLMFFTSVGFSIDMHYCGNSVQSFSLFGKAKNCTEMMETAATKSCQMHKKMANPKDGYSINKKDCCHNRTLNLQADLTSEIQTNDFMVSQQLQNFVIAFVVVFLENRPVETIAPNFALYKPPLIPRDIPVLVQSFLL